MKRKGKNMKKALGILSVLVLITVMLISCNAEQNVNDTVEVSFNVSSSRALTVENDDFISVNSDKLTWYYHGVKKTDTEFKTGQSGTGDDYWTPISTGDRLSATSVEFSQGQWYFEVKAINDAGIQMYYGKTNGNVLLTKEQRTISISVSPFVSGVKGKLVLDSVYIDPKDENAADVAPNRLFINGVPRNISISNDATSLSYTEQVEPGTYTVEVQRVGEEDTGVVLASASKTVVVYSGLTTTIEGSVEEDTTTGTFVPQPTKPEGTETVTVPQSGNLIVVFANVTPSMEVDKSTTVTVPYSAISGYAGKSAELKIAVKNYTSIHEEDFAVSDGNGVAASISLTMKSGETPITYFNGEKVTVETYIETGLSGVTVKYKGTDAQPSDIVYVPATGMLTFSTTHFSEFYVEAAIQARIGEKGYLTLQKAIDAAKSGDTIKLDRNVSIDSQIIVKGKTITLDLNGYTISEGETVNLSGGIIYIGNDGYLTINDTSTEKTGKIDVTTNRKFVNKEGQTTDHPAVWADIVIYPDNGQKAGLTINGGTYIAPYYPISGNGTDKAEDSTKITINGGTFKSIDGLCIYHPQNGTLTISSGSFEGQDTAIEIRSGNLNISGGTFKATSTPSESTANGNGTTSKGSAIAVAQHTTKLPINVNISGGTFEGYSAFYESNPQNNSADDIAKVNLAITGGTFNAINGGNCAVYSQDKKGFITGGTFSTDPSDYVAFGYYVVETADGYVVAQSTSDNLTINNVNQLMQFAASVNNGNNYSGKTITLNRNIDLNNKEWTPIGQKSGNKFSGVFDGNNFKVEGMTISNTTEIQNSDTFDGYAAFFGAINGGTVKNLSVYGSVNSKNAAGVVARVDGNSSVINCHNYAKVTAPSDGKAGGVICLTNAAAISVQNCTNSGTVSGGNFGTAGIVGYANPGVKISDCSNFGNIGDENCKYSGGIVGYATGDNVTGSITKCSNSGEIVAYEECGGIVGIITGSQNVSDCTNTQSVKGTNTAFSGGIVGGFAGGTIMACTNTASVHGKFAGGVVGSAQKGVIENCSGGTAAITSPAFMLGFTGQSFTLSVGENQAAGRILGTNQGSGSNNYTVLKLANNEDDQAIGTVGMCGNLTTWANLKISSGTFYGEPLAGNTTYITLEAGATWGNKAAGTYYCGGLTESSRIATWQIKN